MLEKKDRPLLISAIDNIDWRYTQFSCNFLHRVSLTPRHPQQTAFSLCRCHSLASPYAFLTEAPFANLIGVILMNMQKSGNLLF